MTPMPVARVEGIAPHGKKPGYPDLWSGREWGNFRLCLRLPGWEFGGASPY